jgi:hypothetical protein
VRQQSRQRLLRRDDLRETARERKRRKVSKEIGHQKMQRGLTQWCIES